MATQVIHDEEEMKRVAEDILSILPQRAGANTLTLSGELGAGKTALVRALARRLGVREHITSPTFVVMKKYAVPEHYFFSTLIHIDAYRVEDPAEMKVIGLSEYAQEPGTLICIEWPEHIQEYIPEGALAVSLKMNGEASRTITYGN